MDDKIEIYENRLFELINNLKMEIVNDDINCATTFKEIVNIVGYLSFTKKYNSNNSTFVWIEE